MQARPELIWFHAAAASGPEGALLLAAPRARGKSTLVTELGHLGWTYMSDDLTPVCPDSLMALPFPLTPAPRLHHDHRLDDDAAAVMEKVQVSLDALRTSHSPAPVYGLLFPEFRHGAATRIQPITPAPAALTLLENSWNFDRGRAAAVRCATRIAARTRALRVTFGDGREAARSIDSIMKSSIPTVAMP